MKSKIKIKDALIAITYRCNARCRMCNTWGHPTRPEDEIKPRDLESLPDLDFCNITGGEPFVREDIEEFVQLLSKKAKRIVISTNGFFTERVIRLAKRFPFVGIRVSLEGLAEVNDRLRGLPNGFNKGLRTLVELQRVGLKDIGFGITITDDNIQDLMPLYQLSSSMGVEFATAAVHNSFYFHKFDNRINKLDDFQIEIKKLIKALLGHKKVKNWFRAYFNHGLLNYAAGKPRLLRCPAVNKLIFIDPLGNLMPCNGMEFPIGNLKQSSFEEIWRSSKLKEASEQVAACKKECWMIGSVAPEMKSNIFKPSVWVIKSKIKLALGKEVE